MKFLTSATALSLLFAAQSALAVGPGTGSKIPEPGVWALMGIGAAVFAARHFMKKR